MNPPLNSISKELLVEAILGLFILFGLLVILFKGGYRTFQRNWVLALLGLIFLTPFWFAWAFIELFLTPASTAPTVVTQTVYVTNVMPSGIPQVDKA